MNGSHEFEATSTLLFQLSLASPLELASILRMYRLHSFFRYIIVPAIYYCVYSREATIPVRPVREYKHY
jgi:hypothetical protein